MKMKKLAALLLAGCLVVGNVGIVTAAGEDDNQENQQTTTVTTSEEETDEAGLTVEDGEKTEEITDSKKRGRGLRPGRGEFWRGDKGTAKEQQI